MPCHTDAQDSPAAAAGANRIHDFHPVESAAAATQAHSDRRGTIFRLTSDGAHTLSVNFKI